MYAQIHKRETRSTSPFFQIFKFAILSIVNGDGQNWWINHENCIHTAYVCQSCILLAFCIARNGPILRSMSLLNGKHVSQRGKS